MKIFLTKTTLLRDDGTSLLFFFPGIQISFYTICWNVCNLQLENEFTASLNMSEN